MLNSDGTYDRASHRSLSHVLLHEEQDEERDLRTEKSKRLSPGNGRMATLVWILRKVRKK